MTVNREKKNAEKSMKLASKFLNPRRAKESSTRIRKSFAIFSEVDKKTKYAC